MEYPHILAKPVVVKQKRLVFSLYLNEETGELSKTHSLLPQHWENVRHLTGNLFYCWHDGGESRGSVYFGKYE
jgi:hypothetical protein